MSQTVFDNNWVFQKRWCCGHWVVLVLYSTPLITNLTQHFICHRLDVSKLNIVTTKNISQKNYIKLLPLYERNVKIMYITGAFIAQNVLRVNMNSSVSSGKWNELQIFIFIINKGISFAVHDLLTLEINHNVYLINNIS